MPFTIEPTSLTHTKTFILLHGLGSNGEKFGRELLDTGIASNGQKLQTVFSSAKLIFPTACDSQKRVADIVDGSIYLVKGLDLKNFEGTEDYGRC